MSVPPSFSLTISGHDVGLEGISVPVACQRPLPDSPYNLVCRATAATAAHSKRFPPPILIVDPLVSRFEKQLEDERLEFANKNCDPLVSSSEDSDFSSKTPLVEAWRHLYDITWSEYASKRTSTTSDTSLVSFVESYLILAGSQGLTWIFSEVQRLTSEWAELLVKQQTEEEALEREHRKLVDSLAVSGAADASAINLAAREHIEARERLHSHHRADSADLHRALSQRLRLGVIARASSFRHSRDSRFEGAPRSPSSSISVESDSQGFEARFPSASDASFGTTSLRQDCFTIALGTQVRSTANVKLLAADLSDLVKSVAHVPKAQWLHNVMTLYSTDQSALVVMVDSDMSLFSEPISLIDAATKPVPELHFATYADQIKEINSIARKNQVDGSVIPEDAPVLEAGDFFATRHSNLSGFDVIFHLVWAESDIQKSRNSNLLDGGEITSRNPVIGGLRTLIRTCLEHDITSITVPLLLTTSTRLPESATLAWCARRAELVLKCIKGYLLEHTNHSGASSTACCFAGGIPLGTTAAELTAPGGRPPTIQFLVPKEVSDELFSILTQEVTQIFRVASPLVLHLTQQSQQSQTGAAANSSSSNDRREK